MKETYYTVSGLARFCGVHVVTIKRWAKEGYLPEPIRDSQNRRLWTSNQARQVLAFRKTRTPSARKESLRLPPKGRIT